MLATLLNAQRHPKRSPKCRQVGRSSSLILLSLLLIACGNEQPNSGNANTAEPQTAVTADAEATIANASESDSEAGAKATVKTEVIPVAERPLEVISISEHDYEGSPAIGIRFSRPINSETNFNRYIDVLNLDDQKEQLSSWVLDDSKRLLLLPYVTPEANYEVKLNSGFPAISGKRLAERVTEKVTIRAMPASASFASDGLILPGALARGLPIVAVNLSAVDVEFLRVKPAQLNNFFRNYNTGSSTGVYSLERLSELATPAWSGRFDLAVKANTRETLNLPVQNISELQEPSLYIAVLRKPGQYSYQYQTAYFFNSDIGIQLRQYAEEARIYARSIATAEPLANVKVALWKKDQIVYEGHTNSDGELGIRSALNSQELLTAELDNSITALNLRGSSLDLSEFDLGERAWQQQALFMYGPRDLYRPGEQVDISALLRDHDGRPLPPLPLNAKLYQPDGKTAQEFVWHTYEQGYYQHKYQLPDDAMTGIWRLRVDLTPGKRKQKVFAQYRFQVEEFLPERMKLSLSTADTPLSAGEAWPITVQGDYLYGAPAAGNRLGGKFSLRPDHRPLPALKGFYFGDPDASQYQSWALEEQVLDSSGGAELTVASRWDELNTPLSITYAADLFETGGRPISRIISRAVWPATALVGIRPNFKGNQAPSESNASFDVLKANAAGEKLAASNLDVTLIREDRKYYWEYTDSEGWDIRWTEEEYPVAQQVIDLSAGQTSSLSLPVDWGQYRLEVFDPETQLTTKYRFYAGWSHQDANSARPDRVEMLLDKASYQAGDIANLRIVPPHAGQATVRVEANKLLWQQNFAVDAGGTSIKIPIDTDWQRHDLHISVVVIRPANEREKRTPQRAVGLSHLPLDRSQRRLELEVSAAERVAPNSTATVTVALAPGQAALPKNTLLTLAAVDVGVLSITDFRTPKPAEFFFGRRRYDVRSRDVYDQVIEQFNGQLAQTRWGGDASRMAESLRAQSKPRIVALFQGPAKFDRNGEAKIELAIPDFNGRLRLMALAFSDSSFGAGDAELRVASPVVTQLNLPRFLAAGDKAEFALDVSNVSGKAQTVKLNLNSEQPLQIDDNEQSLQLADGERKTLRFPVRAGFDFTTVAITLDGYTESSAGRENIQREWAFMIRPSWPAVERRYQRVLRTGEQYRVAESESSGLMSNTVRSSLTVSNQPPLPLAESLRYLRAYPYGCVEQTTSGSFPLLFLDEKTANQLGLNQALKDLNDEQRLGLISRAIDRISAMQLPSGGFSMWGNSSNEVAWLSVYVSDFLLTARDRGYSVPDTLLNKALERLSAILQNPQTLNLRDASDKPAHLVLSTRAYAGYVLARMQRAPLGTLRNLYADHHSDAAGPLPLIHLGLALQLQGDSEAGAEAIAKANEQQRISNAYLGDYGSVVRDEALAIALLRRHGHAQAAAERVWKLGDALRDQDWFSTQDQIAIFLAGLALSDDSDKTWTAKLMFGLGDKTNSELVSAIGNWQRPLSLADIHRPTRIESGHDKPLYLLQQTAGYPINAPKPDDSVINIERRWYNTKGEPLLKRELRSGDLVLVELQVTSKQRLRDALVQDLLPGGLELENQNLAHAVKLDDIQIDGKSVAAWMQRQMPKHVEYRDDRYAAAVDLPKNRLYRLFYLARAVTPGRYGMPPTVAEDMYRPALRGVSATGDELIIHSAN